MDLTAHRTPFLESSHLDVLSIIFEKFSHAPFKGYEASKWRKTQKSAFFAYFSKIF